MSAAPTVRFHVVCTVRMHPAPVSRFGTQLYTVRSVYSAATVYIDYSTGGCRGMWVVDVQDQLSVAHFVAPALGHISQESVRCTVLRL